jgi:hypothetical protein
MSLGGCTTGHATRVVDRRAIAQCFLYNSRRFVDRASALEPEPVGHDIGVGAGVLVWVELAEAGPQFPGSHLAVAGDWWNQEPKARAARITRWAAAPVSLVAGGVLVASINIQTDEVGFAAGLGTAGLGYFTHLLVARWSKKSR